MSMRTQDKTALNRMVEFMLIITFVLLVIHLYVAIHGMWQQYGLTHQSVDNFLLKLMRGMGFLKDNLYTKLVIVGLLVVYGFGNKGVKKEDLKLGRIIAAGLIWLIVFLTNELLIAWLHLPYAGPIYLATTALAYLGLIMAANKLSRYLNTDLMKDVFNEANESFPQETQLLSNDDSVNLQSEFQLRGKLIKGNINIVNPYRASIIMGGPGSGKSFTVVNTYIRQMLAKGFSMYVYDFKYPDLTQVAYNNLLKNLDKFKVRPSFYTINFDDPRHSNRCNPIKPEYLPDFLDAYESARSIYFNLNKSAISKQGEFFVESPINFIAAVFWYLRKYQDGKYCTFPHAVEFMSKDYRDIFPILCDQNDLDVIMAPFTAALLGGAMEQLEGQIASARIPIGRMVSPSLYWVMSGNDFSLDINNPEKPALLCVGNNPQRKDIYGAALSLYNFRILRLVNQKHKNKSAVIIDELPTMYVDGIDQLIATARSNKVAVVLAFQDASQLERDYGKASATVIMNTVGNMFCGQVFGDTAKTVQERLGKNLQRRQSLNLNPEQVSSSISTTLDYMVPASRISNLSQGEFVGTIADNVGEDETKLKRFNAKIIVDVASDKAEKAAYKRLPMLARFSTSNDEEKEKEAMNKAIIQNYERIKEEVNTIIAAEKQRVYQENPRMKALIDRLTPQEQETN